ncbi:nitrilase-related carbon-nitrogen hydrolase [Gordonia sp. (in: high G+C Gram-positive bacteria)]|uniref:nitrilase-related carbon-nitrogen hydrolase n=1 Tax=Gordonia sp. (in: high G+C Gram-positive bacteria) TaxID=84139 RepID=UPI003F9BDDFB
MSASLRLPSHARQSDPELPNRSEVPGRRQRPWLLICGLLLLLAAQHGNPDIWIAAWLFAIPLLRWFRWTSILAGTSVLLGVQIVAAAVWVLSIRLPTDGPPTAAIIGASALNALLVLPFLADRLIATRLRERHTVISTLVFPSARVAVEFLIAAVSPYGTVFGMLSATQHENLSLLQIASLTGAYGVSFLVAWTAPVVNEIWSRTPHLRPAAWFAATLALVVAAGSFLLWAEQTKETVRIAGITPSRSLQNVSADLPDPEDVVHGGDGDLIFRTMAPVTADLLAQSAREARAGAKIIVWAEASTQVMEKDLGDLYRRGGSIAAEHSAYIQLATAVYTDVEPYARNIAALVGPDGELRWEYDKTHPLVGMEPTPPGTDPVPTLDTEFGRLAGIICYDLDFGDTADVDADIVLTPAADWPGFGRLHTQKSRIRAIEQGYSVIRQDDEGAAATFGPRGDRLAFVEYESTEQQTMIAQVPTNGHRTPYSIVGDAFAWAAIALLVGAGVLAVRASRVSRGGLGPGVRVGH